MSATNQQMTREQLDELMVVAVSMQRDAEKLGERPVAVFAYAVQLALAELQKTRQQLAAVVAENAGLKQSIAATIGWQESTDAENVESIRMLLNIETPATDAYLAEVRASAVDAAIEKLIKKFEGTGHIGVPVMVLEHFATQLRQGGENE